MMENKPIELRPLMYGTHLTVDCAFPKGIMIGEAFGGKRISTLAVLLDKIFLRKTVSAYVATVGDGIFVEIDRKRFYCDTDVITVEEGTKIAGKQQIYFLLAFATAIILSGDYDEVTAAYNACKTEFIQKGSIAAQTVADFCAVFDKTAQTEFCNMISVREGEALNEQMEAGIRSGALVRDETLDSIAPENETAHEDEEKEEASEETTESEETAAPEENAEISVPETIERNNDKLKFWEIKLPKDNEELWKMILRGDLRIDYPWDEESARIIKSIRYLDSYVPNSVFFKLIRKLHLHLGRILYRMSEGLPYDEVIGNDFVNVAATGSPGSGKSKLFQAVGAALGLPVHVILVSRNTEEMDYTNKITFIETALQSVESECIKGFKRGGIDVLEEINLALTSQQGPLGSAVEQPYIMMENGCTPVSRHPLCVFAYTKNVGTAASRPVNEAFANRFGASYCMEDPDRKTFIELLKKITSMDHQICEWVYDCYSSIVSSLKSGTHSAADVDSILLSLSIRSCIAALQNIEEGSDPYEAINDSIVGKIAETDLELSKKMLTVVYGMPAPMTEAI